MSLIRYLHRQLFFIGFCKFKKSVFRVSKKFTKVYDFLTVGKMPAFVFR